MNRLVYAPLLACLLASPLHAQSEERVSRQTRIARQSVTTGGDRGLFTIPSVETLNRRQYSFGFGWNNLDRTPRDLDINSFPVHGAFGVSGRLTVSASLETQKRIIADNLSQPGFNAGLPFVRDPDQKGLGDFHVGAKYRLQRRRDNIGGVSVRALLKLPTADSAKGLGAGGTDLGADIIFSSLMPLGLVLHSTMGYTATGDADHPFGAAGDRARIKDELRSSLGVAWPSQGMDFYSGAVQGIFEYSGSTFVGAGDANLAGNSAQNPTDVSIGARYLMLDRGITLDIGYRNNIRFDLEFPNNSNSHGMVFAVSYTRPVATPSAGNRFPLVALESDAAELSADATATIVATGFDADNDALTYSWSTTGGRISGAGERVTFHAAGAPAGAHRIRATASDGKGGIATADLEIRIRP